MWIAINFEYQVHYPRAYKKKRPPWNNRVIPGGGYFHDFEKIKKRA